MRCLSFPCLPPSVRSMSVHDSQHAEALAQAAKLLAQAAQMGDLAKRYQSAGLAMLADLCGDTPCPEASSGLRRLAAFRSACAERGIRLTGDDHIGEAGAADLLAVARSTLATWRQEGRVAYRRNPSGQIQYALATLSEFVGSFPTD